MVKIISKYFYFLKRTPLDETNDDNFGRGGDMAVVGNGPTVSGYTLKIDSNGTY